MTQSLGVDTAALEAVARELAQRSDELSRFGTAHETVAAPDQPSGKAVFALTASADHMTGVCADHLLAFGKSVASAARRYEATDMTAAERILTTMPGAK